MAIVLLKRKNELLINLSSTFIYLLPLRSLKWFMACVSFLKKSLVPYVAGLVKKLKLI